jgi:hypothetical protein
MLGDIDGKEDGGGGGQGGSLYTQHGRGIEEHDDEVQGYNNDMDEPFPDDKDGLTAKLLARDIEGQSESAVKIVFKDNMSLEESRNILLDDLDTVSYVWFSFAGMVFRKGPSTLSSSLLRTWNVFLALLISGYYFYTICQGAYIAKSGITAINSVCLIIQWFGLVVGTYYNCRRLRARYKIYSLKSFRRMSVVSVIMAVVISIIVIDLALDVYDIGLFMKLETVERSRGQPFAFVFAGMLLCGNVCFLLADADSARTILVGLNEKIRSKYIPTMAEVSACRSELQIIRDNGFIANTAVIAAALSNLVAVFAVSLLSPGHTVFLLYLFERELVVTLVSLYYIALVNEQSKELVNQLSKVVSTEALKLKRLPQEKLLEVLEADIVLNSLQADPICFSIVGMVLTRKDLFFRFAIWIFGILISETGKSVN